MTAAPSGSSRRMFTVVQLAFDRVEHLVRRAVALLDLAPVPLLEIRVAPGEPLHHRALVDLLLEPVGKLALDLAAAVVERLDHRRHVLPVQDLVAGHYGLRFWTNWKPKRPLMQRLPRVTS